MVVIWWVGEDATWLLDMRLSGLEGWKVACVMMGMMSFARAGDYGRGQILEDGGTAHWQSTKCFSTKIVGGILLRSLSFVMQVRSMLLILGMQNNIV
jgi:hypothetical protein